MKGPNISEFDLTSGLSESYLADVGRAVMTWSEVEFQFDLLFLWQVVMRGAGSGLMRDPRIRELFGQPFASRTRAFRERLDDIEVSPEFRDRVERIMSKLVTLRRERDRLAHSTFQLLMDEDGRLAEDQAMALYKSWLSTKEVERKPLGQGRLRELLARMHDLYWELFHLTLDPELRHALPRQPPQ